jgi:hypothetical protein
VGHIEIVVVVIGTSGAVLVAAGAGGKVTGGKTEE